MKKLLAISCLAFLYGCGGDNDSGDGLAPSNNEGGNDQPSVQLNGIESRNFLANAYKDSATELAFSQAALQRASNPEVRTYAEMMVAHHTMALEEMNRLAQNQSIPLSSSLSEENQFSLASMQALSTAELERTYMERNVAMHDRDHALFYTQGEIGTDSDIRIFAANKLPAIQSHLLMAKTIHGRIDPVAYLKNMYQDGQGEIAMARLVLERSTDPDVRAFAQSMIDDHTRVNAEIFQLAQARSVTLPGSLTSDHRVVMEDLARMSGTDLDKAYMNHNVLVHESGVSQTSAQAGTGSDVDIRAFAARTLPALTMHLQTANTLYENIVPGLLFSAAQDGMGELLLAKTALQKAVSPSVRQFAEHMVNEHSVLNERTRNLAESESYRLPHEIAPEHLRTLMNLAQLSGTAFDQAFMSFNVAVHERDVALFQQYAANPADPEVRAYVEETLPALVEHLAEARQILGSIGQ